jgi:hypothetical protein
VLVVAAGEPEASPGLHLHDLEQLPPVEFDHVGPTPTLDSAHWVDLHEVSSLDLGVISFPWTRSVGVFSSSVDPTDTERASVVFFVVAGIGLWYCFRLALRVGREARHEPRILAQLIARVRLRNRGQIGTTWEYIGNGGLGIRKNRRFETLKAVF